MFDALVTEAVDPFKLILKESKEPKKVSLLN